jgi:hypothetical protein
MTNVGGTPWVRKAFNLSVAEQYLIASSALCKTATVLYLFFDIKEMK